ncbi:hypothetical protein [Streptomyces sp. NPDC058694]|uniref:hypothetical protein n=1 Tax=Streptomyces sp. NPDC058694 TaxID=3346603 RepID=UPI0036537EBC
MAGPVGGAEGFEDGGVAEATAVRVVGPGSPVAEPVVDTFPEVGAPSPRRRAGPEALRCTGRGPAPDGWPAETGSAGPPRLGPEVDEFAAGATGLPGPGVRLAAEAAALSAGFPAAGPTG